MDPAQAGRPGDALTPAAPASAAPSGSEEQRRLRRPAGPHHAGHYTLNDAFYREPVGFSAGTLRAVAHDAAGVWQAARRSPGSLLAPLGEMGTFGTTLLVVLAAALAAGLVAERRYRERVRAGVDGWCRSLSPALAPALGITARGALPAALPLAGWAVWSFTVAIAGVGGPWFGLVGDLTLLWAAYRLLNALLRQVLLREHAELPAKQARRLYAGLRRAAGLGAVLAGVTMVGQAAQYRDDALSLLIFLLHVSVSLLLLVPLLARDSILALLPRVQSRPYERFKAFFRRTYYPMILVSLLVSVLWALGFRELARLFFTRGWALVGLVIGAAFVHQTAERLLRARLVEAQPDSETAAVLAQILVENVSYLLIFAVAALGALAMGLRHSLAVVAGQRIISLGPTGVLNLGDLVVSGLVLFAAARGSGIVRAGLNHSVYPRLHLDVGESDAFNRLLHYVIMLLSGLLVLRIVGISSQSLAIVAGGLSVGIGFGLQNLANNLASGLIILLGRSVRKGDLISVGSLRGTVQEVGMRATVVRTLDNVEVLVPNSQLISETLVNWTHNDPTVRIHVPVGVAYGTDPELVKRVMLEVAARAEIVLRRPEPQVRFAAFGDNSLNFELLAWINIQQIAEPRAQSDLNYALFDALTRNGIEIPFPQRDLNLKPGPAWAELVSALRAPAPAGGDGEVPGQD